MCFNAFCIPVFDTFFKSNIWIGCYVVSGVRYYLNGDKINNARKLKMSKIMSQRGLKRGSHTVSASTITKKLACVALFFSSFRCVPSNLWPQLRMTTITAEKQGKKGEKLSKNKAMLWLKMNTINTDVSWFDDIFFPFDRNVQKNLPLAWEAVE